jgi:hypothetical protein
LAADAAIGIGHGKPPENYGWRGKKMSETGFETNKWSPT